MRQKVQLLRHYENVVVFRDRAVDPNRAHLHQKPKPDLFHQRRLSGF